MIICFIPMIWIIKKESYSGDDAWNELMALETDVTMDALKAKGYIDVSWVMDSENKEITAFLEDARNRNNCRLRIANILEGVLCVKILVYNRDLDAIEMWTMRPNRQQADTPGKRFSTETYAIEEGDVITVYLKNIPNTSFPIAPENQVIIDEALYSYASLPLVSVVNDGTGAIDISIGTPRILGDFCWMNGMPILTVRIWRR